MKKVSLGLIALLGALLLVAVSITPASAHEKRLVGKYTFVVGFINEPAFAMQTNSVDLTICNGKCDYNPDYSVKNGVMGTEKTLKVGISSGGMAPITLDLEPRWAHPGQYNAYFMPSKTGPYTFHFTGMVNGQTIDEKFTSSPTGFEEVQQVTVYPAVATSQSSPNVAALQAQVNEARDNAARATTLGIIGIAAAVLGLALAGFALARRPKPAFESPTAGKEPEKSLRG